MARSTSTKTGKELTLNTNYNTTKLMSLMSTVNTFWLTSHRTSRSKVTTFKISNQHKSQTQFLQKPLIHTCTSFLHLTSFFTNYQIIYVFYAAFPVFIIVLQGFTFSANERNFRMRRRRLPLLMPDSIRINGLSSSEFLWYPHRRLPVIRFSWHWLPVSQCTFWGINPLL